MAVRGGATAPSAAAGAATIPGAGQRQQRGRHRPRGGHLQCEQRQQQPWARPSASAGTGRGGRACRASTVAQDVSASPPSGPAPAPAESEVLSTSRLSAVVKLHVTSMSPDWRNPWQTKTASRSTGSGALISKHPRLGEDGREETVNVILTAAHVVADSTYLQVQKGQSPDKYSCATSAVLHESDIALVEVVGEMFSDIEPLRVAAADVLPALRSRVWVLGFPVGGDEISITEGVVSRVEVQSYSHSYSPALAVTVDAAVNSGNSGGPAVDATTGEIIGIAFQGYAGSDVENQGHLVPTPLIHHFLDGLERGEPTLPTLGICMQRLQSPALRAKLGMDAGETGVMISKVFHEGTSWKRLEEGDVLLSVQGTRLANDGTIVYLGKRLSLISLLVRERDGRPALTPPSVPIRISSSQRAGAHDAHRTDCAPAPTTTSTTAQHSFFIGDTITCEIKRGGVKMSVDVELGKSSHLVPRSLYDVAPRYYLVGGMLFQPLCLDFLRCWGNLKDAPTHLMQEYHNGYTSEGQDEVVVLTQILSDGARARPADRSAPRRAARALQLR